MPDNLNSGKERDVAIRWRNSNSGGSTKPSAPPNNSDNFGITAFWRKKAPDAGKKPEDRKPASWRWRTFRVFAIFVLVLLLLPVTLGLIYRPSSVHPISTLMAYDWASGNKVDRRWVPFEKISPQLIRAVIMSEDGQFCSHRGVDWAAINLVIDSAIDGEKIRGASTITMQTVKNLFLWNSRSYVRKALEVPLALYVNAILPKRRQLEIYLNIAEWGPGIFGIEAAAQYYFGIPASRLNRTQSALLAVALPNPKLRNPKKPSRRMKVLARINRARVRIANTHVRCLN